MHINIDSLQSQLRRDPLLLDARSLIILPEQAKLYKLKEGQIIEGIIQQNAIGLSLNSGGQEIPIPNSWLAELGKKYEWVVSIVQNGNYILKPMNGMKFDKKLESPSQGYQKMATLESKTVISGEKPVTEDEISIGEAFSRLSLIDNKILSSYIIDNKLYDIQTEPPIWPQLFRLLNTLSKRIKSEFNDEIFIKENINSNTEDCHINSLYNWLNLLKNPNYINPDDIHHCLVNSGLLAEQKLKQKETDFDTDLKLILTKILNNSINDTPESITDLKNGIKHIEKFQLDAIHGEILGYINLQFILPTSTGDLWGIQFYRPIKSIDYEDPLFHIDLHSQHSTMGALWLRSTINNHDELNMTLWIHNLKIANIIQKNISNLAENLLKNNLILKSFNINAGINPYDLNLTPSLNYMSNKKTDMI